MKVGTDGVLLGAWTLVNENECVLDVGTGTGLIALMLAQKNNSIHIQAIDIDETAVVQAERNISASPFPLQVNVSCKSLQYYEPLCGFDLIVSNPPFFKRSLHSPNLKRTLARHTDTLSAEDLLQYSYALLKDEGRLSLIYPFELKDELLSLALSLGYSLSRLATVYPTSTSMPKRLLLELKKKSVDDLVPEPVLDTLVIEEKRHVYTSEYKLLTKDYYLNF